MMRLPRRLAPALLAACLLCAAPSAASAHIVLPGETLSGIAAVNGLSPAELASANGLSPQAFVIAGTTLRIPQAGACGCASPASPAVASGGGHVVAPGETLTGIAAANGLSAATLASANGLSPTSFVIAGTRLRIPAAGSAPAASPATAAAPAAGGHLVVPGETLTGIAAANGLSPAALASANGLSPTSFVIAGTRLTIPAAGSAPAASPATAAAPAAGGHLVVPGETLTGIAAANGLSPAALASANGLSPTSFVIAGTRLKIPAAGSASAAAGSASAAAPAPAPMGGYTVRPGDTLTSLAMRSRVSVDQVAAMNGLSPTAMLLVGQPLKLPTGSPVLAANPTGPATPVSTAITPAATPNPTPGHVTAGEIAGIAGRHGVPGSLAAAIAWQESGFNNAMVSSANARGVMQIMPGTWDWVQTYLAQRPLDPNSPLDNVHAGSLYLGQLLRDTGGDPAMAAAAYYQGLSSVRRIGMLPETRRYVDNVIALRGRFGG